MGLSLNQQKFVHSLHLKKNREDARAFIVEGDKMVRELLQQTRWELAALYGLGEWLREQAACMARSPAPITEVSAAELKKISTLTTPQSVLAVVKMPPAPAPLLTDAVCLYLDGIQDPGNLGTILRTADWFGLAAVYCSPDCADVFNSKTIQAGMGAFLRVPTREITLAQLLTAGPENRSVWGAVLGGQSVREVRFGNNDLLVIGNEGRGIRPDTQALLTHRVTIPGHPHSGAESLNAAVAAGILMYALSGE